MSTLARTAITNTGRFQVRIEEPVPHDKVADVRQAALGIQEYKVQFVLADGIVVPLDDIDRIHGLDLVDRVQLAQSILCWLQWTYLAFRAPGLRHAICPEHLGPTTSHCLLFQVFGWWTYATKSPTMWKCTRRYKTQNRSRLPTAPGPYKEGSDHLFPPTIHRLITSNCESLRNIHSCQPFALVELGSTP